MISIILCSFTISQQPKTMPCALLVFLELLKKMREKKMLNGNACVLS